jgi:FAD synthase
MAILLAIQMLHCPTPSAEREYTLKFKFSDRSLLYESGLRRSSNRCADKSVMSNFKNKNDPVAANIFDFDLEIYNKQITVYFYKKLRDEEKYDSINQLKSQLAVDKENAIKYLI